MYEVSPILLQIRETVKSLNTGLDLLTRGSSLLQQCKARSESQANISSGRDPAPTVGNIGIAKTTNQVDGSLMNLAQGSPRFPGTQAIFITADI
jgi:hypothetical protein